MRPAFPVSRNHRKGNLTAPFLSMLLSLFIVAVADGIHSAATAAGAFAPAPMGEEQGGSYTNDDCHRN